MMTDQQRAGVLRSVLSHLTGTHPVRKLVEVARPASMQQQQLPQGVRIEAPLSPSGVGARIRGLDLSRSLSPAEAGYVIQTFHTYKVLCVAGQRIESAFSLAHFERFCNHIGAPLPHPSTATRYRERGSLQVQSNVVGYWRPGLPVGHRLKTPDRFHTDIDYEVEPSSATIFVAHTTPTPGASQSGQTEFIDLEMLLASLSPPLVRIAEAIQVERSEPAGEAMLPGPNERFEQIEWPRFHVAQSGAVNRSPLVTEHPYTGRRALYGSLGGVRETKFSGARAEDIARVISAVTPTEENIQSAAFQRSIYRHRYERGDVVMWDNFALWHRAPAQVMVGTTEADGARFLYRCSVKGPPALRLPRDDSEEWLRAHIAGAYRTSIEDVLRPPENRGITVARGAGRLVGTASENAANVIR